MSNTGFVYYITADSYGGSNNPVDVKIYEQWRSSWIGNGNQLELNYHRLTANNIKQLNPSFEPEFVPDLEYLGEGFVNTDYREPYVARFTPSGRGGPYIELRLINVHFPFKYNTYDYSNRQAE